MTLYFVYCFAPGYDSDRAMLLSLDQTGKISYLAVKVSLKLIE